MTTLKEIWAHCQMDEERANDRKMLGLAPGPRSLPPALNDAWFKLPPRLRQRFWRETGHFKVSPSYDLIVDMYIVIWRRETFDAEA